MSMRKKPTKPRLFAQRNTNGDFIVENLATPEGAQASEQLDGRLPLKLEIAALGADSRLTIHWHIERSIHDIP